MPKTGTPREVLTPGRLKGGIFRSHLQWIKDKHPDEMQKVLDRLPADTKQALTGAILATSWFPFAWLMALDRAVAAEFGGGDSTIRGLVINRFTGRGIHLATSHNNVVEGNFIGITPDGTVRGTNSGVRSVAVVGGNTPDKRNIISGNHIGVDSSVTVLGNYIGTDSSGLQEGFGNFSGVINSAFVIGNVITGNFNGISAGEGAVIQGNLIGPFADGSPAFGNQIGVRIAQSSNEIGGLGPDEGNVIAYNGTGVQVLPASDLIPVPTSNSILSNLILPIAPTASI